MGIDCKVTSGECVLISAYERGKRAGKEEAAEWVKRRVFDVDYPIPVGDSVYARFRKPVLQDELQAKLREWGEEVRWTTK